jgi:hypothetical protein
MAKGYQLVLRDLQIEVVPLERLHGYLHGELTDPQAAKPKRGGATGGTEGVIPGL